MKVIVTGSSGMIGTRLCEKLLEKGHGVVGADWNPNTWQPAIDKLTVSVDLRDGEKLAAESAKLKGDIIVHLAANARVYDLVERPDLARDNILTTFNALEFARKNGIKRFIFASSRESYGNGPNEIYREDMVRIENCESAYSASKLSGEALVQAYRRCYGIEGIIIRFSNVYGMYDDSDRLVPLYLRQAKRAEPLNVFGKDKSLDFTYIDDAIDGVLLLLEKFEQAKNDTFNIAFGKGEKISDIAELVKKLLKSASPIVLKESRTGEVTRYTADIGKIRGKLGFDPKVSIEEGLRKSAEWYGKR